MTGFELATQYAFFMTMSGMVAGAGYFFMERNNLVPRLSPVASLMVMVALIAAINYYSMVDLVEMSLAGEGAFQFPTEFRYVDWILTTPLLLAVIALLTDAENKVSLMAKLMVADVLMIALGYLGEVSVNQEGASLLAWMYFLAAMIPFAYIVVVLFTEISEASGRLPEAARDSFDTLKYFVAIGWMVYPIGFMASLLGMSSEFLMLRELAYCVADLINKIGFGLMAVHVARRISLREAGLEGEPQAAE
jgi:bacteriorhodopsin